MFKRLRVLLAVMLVAAFTMQPAQAVGYTYWATYQAYLGQPCGISHGWPLTESEKDAQVASGVADGWRGVRTAPGSYDGPCVSVPTRTFYEEFNCGRYTCFNPASALAKAKEKLEAATNCPGIGCSMSAGDTYKYEIRVVDTGLCMVFHYSVTITTFTEEWWNDKRTPVYAVESSVNHCNSPIPGCGLPW